MERTCNLEALKGQPLETKSLSYSYAGGKHVIRELTLKFSPGEMIAITGRSGGGKSTLLYLLGLMLRPTGGSVSVGGMPLSSFSDQQAASLRALHFGFLFQDALLDPSRTVLDNVLESDVYRGHFRDSRSVKSAQGLLEQFGVSLGSGRKPTQVSGGQAQRIALCRALLGNPAIILADEPTGNLDAESAELVNSALRARAHEGGVVIVATHDENLRSFCDSSVSL